MSLPYLKEYVASHALYQWLRGLLPWTPKKWNGSCRPDSKSAVQPLSVLFIFLFGQFIAAFISEQRQGVRPPYVAAYSIVAFVTLIAMGVIACCRQKDGKDGSEMYVHDQGTVALGKWLIPTSGLLFASFVWAGFTDNWPNQKIVAPPTVAVADFDDYGGLAGLRLGIRLNKSNFTGSVPPAFKLRTHFNDSSLIDGWTLEGAKINRIKPDRHIEPLAKQAVVFPFDYQPGEFDIDINGANDPSGEYWLDLFLRPSGAMVEEYNRLNPDIPEQKQAKEKLLDKLRQQLETLRKDARERILSRGAITLRVLPK